MRTSRLAPLLLVLAAIPGCSLGDEPSTPPQLGPSSGDEEAAAKLGFPASATKNTIRVGGGDAAADAAGVANAVFPGTSTATRPTAVVLVDSKDWQAGVTASVLTASPDRRAAAALRRRRAAGGHRRHARAAQAQGLGPVQGRPGDPHRRRSGAARRPQGRRDRGQGPLRARGRHRPLLLRRARAPVGQRDRGLRRAGRVRDARGGLGRPLGRLRSAHPQGRAAGARRARPSPSTRSRRSSCSAPRR